MAPAAASIGRYPTLAAWLRGPMRARHPHRAALVLHGSAHSLGFLIEERLAVDLPESYLDGLTDPSGQLCSPILDEWMRTRVPQYFEPRLAPGIEPRWLRNFVRHGLRNFALLGAVDASARRLILLALYDLEEPCAPHPEACAALLESVRSALSDAAQRARESGRMTPAEWQVLKWVRLGKTNHEIGLILNRSPYTVKTHIQRMLEKTGLDNRIQLSEFADRALAGAASAGLQPAPSFST